MNHSITLATLSFCIHGIFPGGISSGPALAHRTGSPSCWAEFKIDENRALCIPQTLWEDYLESPRAFSLCGTWQGKWKAHSPPENSPGVIHVKKTLLRFIATGLPQSESAAPSIWDGSRHVIEKAREAGSRLLKNHDSLGICRHLLLGEMADENASGVLRILGFVHLLTATGIHLYALSRAWDVILARIFAFFEVPIALGLMVKRVLVAATWLFSWLLCGARLGMIRPWIIVMARELARFLGFRWRKWAPLMISLAVDSAPGRWFYALAVGGGMMALEEDTLSREHFQLALGSWIFTAVWEVNSHGLVSIATPILSYVTLPLFTLGLYPALLLSLVAHGLGWITVSTRIASATSGGITLLMTWLAKAAMGAPCLWVIPSWSIWMGAVTTALIFFLVKKPGIKAAVILALAAFLIRFFSGLAADAAPRLATTVEQLDVGQGDAALILNGKWPNLDAGLIDSGSAHALSDANWIELLAERGITHVSWIALTHLDEDHSGGVLKLARLLPIRCVAASEALLETEKGNRYSQKLGGAGLHAWNWKSDCIPYPVLPPDPRDEKKKNNADMSAVYIPLVNGGFYLSAGDADASDEPRIGNWARNLANGVSFPRILKISHHGSKTSTAPNFLKEVSPTEAWISVGMGNPYGHPAQPTLDQLSKLSIPVFRTDRDGAIRSDVTSKGVHHPRQKHPP